MNKVVIHECADYDNRLSPALDDLLGRLGNLDDIVKSGKTVLIKPNLLSGRAPDQCITTHPELVRAIIRKVRAAGAEPVVADSPAGVFKLEKVWEATGFSDMCEEENTPLINLEKHGSRRFNVNGMSFSIALPVLEADLVINVPKLKTHMLTIFTNAIKNTYGCVPGAQKMMLHRLYPAPAEFCRLIAAVYGKVAPGLTICDAVRGMQGNGPSAGEPVRLGFLAASYNGVALDFAMCKILGIPEKSVRYLEILKQFDVAGTTGNDNSVYELDGNVPRNEAIRGFKTPSTFYSRLIPGWAAKKLAKLIWNRPYFTDACVACGICAKACPVNAITMPESGKPVLQSNRCIECCCCHEVCPENAVEMKGSPVLRLIRFVR